VDLDFERNAKILIQEQVNKMIFESVKVHPDIADILNVVFGDRDVRKGVKAIEAVSAGLKKSILSLSLFHPVALGEASIATMGLLKTAGIYLDLPALYRAVMNGDTYAMRNQELAKDAIVNAAIVLGATADIPVNKIQNALNTLAKKTENVFAVGQATKIFASFNDKWDKALWVYLHDTLKLMAYEHYMSKFYDPSKDELIQKRAIGEFINNSFGGQNWELMLISPRTLQTMSHWLLSPDWTISTIRQGLGVTGFGFLEEEGKKIGRKMAAMFWIKAMIYFGMGINLMNMTMRAMDRENNKDLYPDELGWQDHTMFGNSMGHKTHLFLGRNEDGTERYLR